MSPASSHVSSPQLQPLLVIGNKNYSSWSLRPWLALKWAGIPFDERVVFLGGPGYGKSQIPEVLALSPSGRVPVLHVGETRIWDSLAIIEWAAEVSRQGKLWPDEPMARAVCRSLACEMHSSFGALRRDLGMNIRRRTTPRDWPGDTRADLARVVDIFTATRRDFGAPAGGPFLFGARTAVDAMFAPVCTRLRTYGVPLEGAAAAYCAAVLEDAAFREWERAAEAETQTIAETDAL